MGRHDTHGGGGFIGGGGRVGGEDFCDSEIEEFDGTVRFNEDIAGFEVAVDDEVLVGVVDGGADVAEEAEAGFGGEFVVVAKGVDGVAFDILHDKVGSSIFGGTAVEEACDVRMIEGGDDLAFAAEALDDAVLLHTSADHFYGD